MTTRPAILFAMNSTRELGEQIAQQIGVSLGEHEERDFEDGEHKTRPLCNVRNRDVFVISSLHGDHLQTANDKLCRLLFFLGAIRDAAAARVIALVPYLCYARKDRQTKPRDPVTTRYIAGLFESVGTDAVVTMDVHNLAAFQNSFRRTGTDHLQAVDAFVDHFAGAFPEQDFAVVSPDAGGMKRAALFRQALDRRTGREASGAMVEKHRSGGKVRGKMFVGDVEGKVVVLVDDLISSGGTLARAAVACQQRGAVSVHAAATHGLFVKDAERTLGESPLEQVAIADTVPPFRVSEEFRRQRLTVLPTAGLWARAVRAIHDGESLAESLEYPS